ncbi:hypothetical protein [Saccharopolyspora hattusasensis]|uniref:hypothetical protein n=1 Tax=Saccharopolyspora hattusasensis TaxID=1128679 RepID=UPI003D970B85
MPNHDHDRGTGAVRIVGGALEMGLQRQQLRAMVTASTAGARCLSSGDVYMAPGHYSAAHIYAEAEIIVRILDGYAATVTWGDEGTAAVMRHEPGQDLYVPAGLAHAAINLSRTHPVLAYEVRSTPRFNEDVSPRPDLDAQLPLLAQQVQDEHVDRVRQAQARGELPWW